MTTDERLDRLERAVLLLSDAANRLAAAIAERERWPLDRSEVLNGGRTPFEWGDDPKVIMDISNDVEEDERSWMVQHFLIRDENEDD